MNPSDHTGAREKGNSKDVTEIRRAVVTGPTGGIGTALIEVLLEAGIEVTALVRPGSARADKLSAYPGVRAVPCGLDGLREISESAETDLSGQYDAFFHLGWDGTTGTARLDRARQEKNVGWTLDAVRLAYRLGCKVFVGAGSQSEFGPVDGVMRPELPCDPDNEYGKAKLRAGILSRELAKDLGFRHEWMRILSAFGPGDAPTTMVMGTLLAFLGNEERQFTKGDQIWDYIYTKDVGRAFLMAAERGRDGGLYVVGSGKSRRLRDFVEAMRDIAAPGRALEFGGLPYYRNQVMKMEADISALTADTGFTPSYSFEDGIREIVSLISGQSSESM